MDPSCAHAQAPGESPASSTSSPGQAAATPQPAQAPPAQSALGAAVVTKKTEKPGGWRKPVAWSSVGLGVAGIAVGAWRLTGASTDQDALDTKLNDRTGAGIVGIDKTTYRAEQDRINTARSVGAVFAGAGLVAAGVGAWLMFTRPATQDITLTPTIGRTGFGLSARF